MNKRFAVIMGLALIFQLVLLPGCFGGNDEPAHVVDEVYKAVQKQNAEKVVSFLDPVFVEGEAEQADLSVKDFKEQLVQAYDEMFETMDKMISFTIGQVEVDGDDAIAYVTIVQEEIGEEEVSVNLVKRDGKWYVLP